MHSDTIHLEENASQLIYNEEATEELSYICGKVSTELKEAHSKCLTSFELWLHVSCSINIL